MINVYTDGACLGNPGPGGWAALIHSGDDKREVKGHEDRTTSNRMEIVAAIKGLENTPHGDDVTIYSDSQYLIYTMTRNWKRKANLDLWEVLDKMTENRNVHWAWVKGHNDHPENEKANILANKMAGISNDLPQLTHFDSSGRPRMVDVTKKKITDREAVAKGTVVMKPSTLKLIKQGKMAKGDVLAVAQMAGIMAAKQTPYLIPMCHPLPITSVDLDCQMDEERSVVDITAIVKTSAQTGVEMEALTSVSVAALTIYDMCKAVDRAIRIDNVRLARKSGGKSGEIVLE
ncbi:cyclic pyranopterin monophosphate synthase MoaC [Chloroflexota bacterium]